MSKAEQNYCLLQEIEANRLFLLAAYQQNPQLLENAEDRIKEILLSARNPEPRTPNPGTRSAQRGISLVELIMFIVIISTALAGILLVMNQVTGHSADTLLRKQALAIAESLLEEVELMPFTYCDPNDASAVSATSTAGCTGGAGANPATSNSQDLDGTAALNAPIGQPSPEIRGSTSNPFDNVADYGGYTMNNITDLAGNTYTGYNASVAMTRAGTALLGGTAVAGDALQITVTVTAPDNSQVVLDGYRTRYAPNSLP